MNTKSVFLVLFISFFIFSTIGCISTHSPDDNVILTEEYQIQEFKVDNIVYNKLEWYFDDVLVKRDNTTGDMSNFILNWYNLSNGEHKLVFDNGIDTITWGVTIIKENEVQNNELDYVDSSSWNDIRSEWKNRSDKLMNGEEI